MSVHGDIDEQIAAAYARMATEARYRPSAPSDGFGNIDIHEAELLLDEEQARYAENFLEEEATNSYWLGNPSYADRPALIYILEAARTLNGQSHDVAAVLLRMALEEVEAEGQRRRNRS